MKPLRTVTLTIDSSLENVSLVGNALRGLLEREEGPAEDAALVELAVCEAVNNAVIHAYGRRPGQPVEVSLTLGAGRLEVRVADRGRPFEAFPETLPGMPDAGELDDVPLGGWGLRIIGQAMEHVDYRSEEGRNTLTMSRPWNGVGTGQA
ncbi:Serine/threonine-protein kinase BtrW [Fundidesulfovibrio magnetotacticus]|uniref:Serine/threonine-protein kinase BtrW n=1 Tax=Fundidesulfovibrio magnetotacticus TaxID=2730080 RepID=A0A6V8LNG4_9BACT|nr:ATP-binding protein [Fundidesulfovibrio magnetotacticus]GFK94152.1 Serine/threonine-protein kinase BtrW [Fundidesulfovibrio magnetotacticus]